MALLELAAPSSLTTFLENQMMVKFADICQNTVIWQKHQQRRSFEQAVQPG